MPIGDILLKVSRNQDLTPQEQEELRFWGNLTQSNNSFIGGLQNGGSEVFANSISANDINVGFATYSNLGVSLTTEVSTANNAETLVSGYIKNNAGFGYADQIPYTTSFVTIPATGTYYINAFVQFASNSTGLRKIRFSYEFAGATPSSLLTLGANTTAVNGDVTMLSIAGHIQFNKGQTLGIHYFQNSGGALDAFFQLIVKQVGLAQLPMT